VFRVDNDAKIREFALEKQFVERILDRIQIVSKEVKRKWVDELPEEEKEKEKEEVMP
jgi:Mn-dependent DtxR family transcriptional regulator